MTKRPQILILAALAGLLTALPAAAWTPPLPLTATLGRPIEPRIVASEGLLHVFWIEHDDLESTVGVRYTRSTDGGSTWSPPAPIFSTDYSPTFLEGLQVAAEGLDLHVAWMKFKNPYSNVFYKRSRDGGLTWSGKRRLSRRHKRILNYAPRLAVAGDTVYVVWEMENNRTQKSKIVLRRSFDGGARWTPRRRLAFLDRTPLIAADSNRVHLVYGAADGVYHRRSSDLGDSWRQEVSVTSSLRAFLGSLVADGDSLHLAWSEVWGWEYTPSVWYKRSLDRGDTWRDERQMHHRRGAFPALAALGNEVHFVWSGVKTRLYYKKSLEAGWSWEAREHLARGKPYSSTNWDEQPAIAVSADGVAHVVYSVDLGMLYHKRSR